MWLNFSPTDIEKAQQSALQSAARPAVDGMHRTLLEDMSRKAETTY